MMVFESPVGPLTIRVNDEGALEEIRFSVAPAILPAEENAGRIAGAALVIEQLTEYFAGRRREFDLPLAPRGTPLQLPCWNELQRIPHGAHISDSERARRIPRPNAVRAVGAANGANPIPIIIPCHRVIGADGTLTGYGGGLPLKKRLLALEGAI